MSIKYKLFCVTAVMKTDEMENPIVFAFDLPGIDENSVGLTLSTMDSIHRIISIEETTSTKKGEIYKNE